MFKLKLMRSMGTSPLTPLEKSYLQTQNVRLIHMKYSRRLEFPLRVPLNLILRSFRPELSIRRNTYLTPLIMSWRQPIHSSSKLQLLEGSRSICCLLLFWLSLFNVDLDLHRPLLSQHLTRFSCLKKVIAQVSTLLGNLRLIEKAYVQLKNTKWVKRPLQ